MKVTNKQFSEFVLATGYRTDARERRVWLCLEWFFMGKVTGSRLAASLWPTQPDIW